MSDTKETSFFYIFHSPIEKVYNIFRSKDLITATFHQNVDITQIKRKTTLDDNGNEFSVLWNHKTPITFKVESIANLPYFKAFRHRSVIMPPQYCPSDHTYNFFWNSTDKVTVFKFTAIVKDCAGRESITKYIFDHKDSMCLATENFLMTTLTNLEENESISISKPIEDVWNFLDNVQNQKYFYPEPDLISIEKITSNTIKIIDDDNKMESTYQITKVSDNNEKREILLELVKSNVPLPKQMLSISVIKMDDKQCFLIFKHMMKEYIAFDVLMSYSSQKKKILKKLKVVIEKGTEEMTNQFINQLDDLDNYEDNNEHLMNDDKEL